MAPRVSAGRDDLDADTRSPSQACGRVHSIWDRYFAPAALLHKTLRLHFTENRKYVAMQQLAVNQGLGASPVSGVVFSLWVGRFKLVAGGQHGQTADHPIHVETVGRTGAGFYTRLR